MSKSGKTKLDPTKAPVSEPAATVETPAPAAQPAEAPKPAETRRKTKTPAPAAAAPPQVVVAATPPTEEQLADQYDLGDSGYDPSLDAFPTRAQAAPAASPEPEPASETPAETEKPAHAAETVAFARTLGLDDAEISEMTPAELGRTLNVLSRRQRQWQPPQPQAAPPESPTARYEAEDAAWRQKQLDKGLDEEIVAELLADRQERRALKAELGQLKQNEQRREQLTAAERMDRLLIAHNPEWFGKDSYGSYQPTSNEAIRRRNIEREAHALAGYDQQQGRPVKPLEHYIRAALAALVPAKAAAAPPPAPKPETNGHAKPRISEEVWNAAGSARPTSRTAAPPKGDRAAMERVKQFLDESPGVVDESVDDFGDNDEALKAGLLD